MAIRDEIDRILEKRKARSEQLNKRMNEVDSLRSTLESTKSNLNMRSWNIPNEEMKKQYTEIFRKIDTSEIQQTSDQLIAALKKGIERFSRDYLSIATIGKQGQGKSKLLQSIGGLCGENEVIGNKVIPSFAVGSCTGAVSVIWNDADLAPGQVSATISFCTREEFLGIIRSYIIQIDPDYLGNNLSYNQIASIPLAEFNNKCDKGNAAQRSAFNNLEKIVTRFNEIKHLPGSPAITLTDADAIQSYVAMNNGKPLSDPERVEFINYLAVSRADIRCRFFSDVGKVRLVDTVGLGATQIGIEEAMLRTVDKECDAAIVLNMPVMRGMEDRDLEIYMMLRDHFQKREINKWLFYLINRVVTERFNNTDNLELFFYQLDRNCTEIADKWIIDAGNPDEVEKKALIPLLQKLLHNLDEIDSIYLNGIDEAEKSFKQALSRFRRNLPAALPRINVGQIEGMQAFKRGQDFYKNRLSVELKDIVKEWSQRKNETDETVLWGYVQPILERLDSLIPSPEEIDSIICNNGTITPNHLWELMLHNIRTSITDRFISIDNELEVGVRDFKNSLVKSLYLELRDIIADEDKQGEDTDSDMVEWLKSMMDNVLSSNEDYEQIRKGFEFLYNFQFSTRVEMIQEVRRQLYIINPICNEYAAPEYQFTYENCGNEIHFYLTSRMAVIEDELRYHLKKLYNSPNRALYAAAEEFYDRLIFASERRASKLIDMQDIWGRFFQEYSEKLSTADMNVFTSVNGLIEMYNDMLETVNYFGAAEDYAERRQAQ
ncbi:MAG: hypothetical protein Q4D81_02765 [Eubacteriales bacterium]|nr:hypothetical protein [Eubacteriales bacterium]